MIFSSKNEDGVPAWKQVKAKTKTVTRRGYSLPVGIIRAIQPKRTKMGIGFIRILSCIPDEKWCKKNLPQEAEKEAKREGFKTWDGLWFAINKMYPKGLPGLYRIEFELV